ncbi:hypothetical protein OC861_004949 [Tilletia horrida]|nr:hypothetical protein OC861_004949 [Tilletia horrida]
MAPATKAETEAPPAEIIAQNRRIATNFVITKAEKDSEFAELRAKDGPKDGLTQRAAGPSTTVTPSAGPNVVEELEPGIISSEPGSRPPVLLEVGGGVGNTIYPLIEKSQALKVHCCDFSPRAVDFVKLNPLYSEERVHAFVHDLASPEGPLHEIVSSHPIGPPTVITMFFVLSAIPPEHHVAVLKSLADCLRQGPDPRENVLLFRDYAHLDLAQVRFHARIDASFREPALLSEDHPYYRRGDGTLTYFFEDDRLRQLADQAGLEGNVEVLVKVKVNRKLDSRMERRFIQARWKLKQPA